VDFQIKLNGQRIETGEIEAVMRQVEAVEDALVVLSGGGKPSAFLVGYAVAEGVDEASIRMACEGMLPGGLVMEVCSSWVA